MTLPISPSQARAMVVEPRVSRRRWNFPQMVGGVLLVLVVIFLVYAGLVLLLLLLH